MLSGLGINGLQIAILLAVIIALNKEFDRVKINNIKNALTMVWGKIIPYWVVAIISFMMMVMTVHGVFAVPWNGSIVETLLLGSAFTFLLIAVCFVFSGVFHDPVQAIQMPLLYLMPGLLYSGLSWPNFSMSSLGQAISTIMPLKYICMDLRNLLLLGYSPTLFSNVIVMYISGTILFFIAGIAFYFRKKALTKEVSL